MKKILSIILILTTLTACVQWDPITSPTSDAKEKVIIADSASDACPAINSCTIVLATGCVGLVYLLFVCLAAYSNLIEQYDAYKCQNPTQAQYDDVYNRLVVANRTNGQLRQANEQWQVQYDDIYNQLVVANRTNDQLRQVNEELQYVAPQPQEREAELNPQAPAALYVREAKAAYIRLYRRYCTLLKNQSDSYWWREYNRLRQENLVLLRRHS